MKFWDASAIVPLLVNQPPTQRALALAAQDPAMAVWWGSEVECVSALARLERHGTLNPQTVVTALKRLSDFAANWDEIDPSMAIRDSATRFLRVHALRAADALQLAAAYIASERRPSSLEVVTLDQRLAEAARKEGFATLDLADD